MIELSKVKGMKVQGTYDEVVYWNQRPYPTSCDDGYTRAHTKFIREELNPHVNTLLDFGPGVGRLLHAYEGLVDSVVGYDISSTYMDRLLDEARKYSFKFRLITDVEIRTLPFSDGEFSVVVASEVFLHQRPENILLVMEELIRVAKKVIAVSWMEQKPFDVVGSTNYDKKRYCFSYDYPRICADQGWSISMKTYKRQVLFTYWREE